VGSYESVDRRGAAAWVAAALIYQHIAHIAHIARALARWLDRLGDLFRPPGASLAPRAGRHAVAGQERIRRSSERGVRIHLDETIDQSSDAGCARPRNSFLGCAAARILVDPLRGRSEQASPSCKRAKLERPAGGRPYSGRPCEVASPPASVGTGTSGTSGISGTSGTSGTQRLSRWPGAFFVCAH
jgi:hypothetical protein